MSDKIFVNFIFYVLPVVYVPAKKNKNYTFVSLYNPEHRVDTAYNNDFSRKSIVTFGYHTFKYNTDHKYRMNYDIMWSFKKLVRQKNSKNVVAIIEEARDIFKHKNMSNHSEAYITETLLAKFGIPYVPEGRGFI